MEQTLMQKTKLMTLKCDDQGTPCLVQRIEFILAGRNLKLTFANQGSKLIPLREIFKREPEFLSLPNEKVEQIIEKYCQANWGSIEPDTLSPLIQKFNQGE